MANICDFVSELGDASSPLRAQWMADKTKAGRMQVAKDFGLSQVELKAVKEALDQNSSKPVEDACAGEIQALWVK